MFLPRTCQTFRAFAAQEVGAIEFVDAHGFRRQTHRQESLAEGVVDEGDQGGAAAVILAERRAFAVSGFLDFRRHAGDQFRVGAAEAVNRLFGIADPGAGLGDLRQRHEQRQLQRAGVLEFID